MTFTELKNLIHLHWNGKCEELILLALLDNFHDSPEFYSDSFLSVESIINILKDKQIFHTQKTNNLEKSILNCIDYLVSEELKVLNFRYEIDTNSGRRLLTSEDLHEAIIDGYYIDEDGVADESFQEKVIVTFYFNKAVLDD